MSYTRKYSSRYGLRERGKSFKKNFNVCGFFMTVNEMSHHLDSLKEKMVKLRNFEIGTLFNFLKKNEKIEFITAEDLLQKAYEYHIRLDRISLRQLIKLHDTTFTAKLDFEDFCSFLAPHDIEKIQLKETRDSFPEKEVIFLFLRFLEMSCKFLKKIYDDSECRSVLIESNNESFNLVTGYRSNKLDFYALKNFLEKNHFHCQEKDIVRILSMIDINKDGNITGDEFKYFVDVLRGSKTSKLITDKIWKREKDFEEFRRLISPRESTKRIEFHESRREIDKVKYSNIEKKMTRNFSAKIPLINHESRVNFQNYDTREKKYERPINRSNFENFTKIKTEQVPFSKSGNDFYQKKYERREPSQSRRNIRDSYEYSKYQRNSSHSSFLLKKKSEPRFENKNYERRKSIEFKPQEDKPIYTHDNIRSTFEMKSVVNNVMENKVDEKNNFDKKKFEKNFSRNFESKYSMKKIPEIEKSSPKLPFQIKKKQEIELSSYASLERKNSQDTLKPMISFGIHENDFSKGIFESSRNSGKENEKYSTSGNINCCSKNPSIEKKPQNLKKNYIQSQSRLEMKNYITNKAASRSRSRSQKLSPPPLKKGKKENRMTFYPKNFKEVQLSPKFNFKNNPKKEEEPVKRKVLSTKRPPLREIRGSLDNFQNENTVYLPSSRTQQSRREFAKRESVLRESREHQFHLRDTNVSISTTKMSLNSIDQIDALTLCRLNEKIQKKKMSLVLF